MPALVKLVSAPWCKRCHELKPDIAAVAAIAGATLEVVNFDELEDDAPVKLAVASLPTILMQMEAGGPWASYTAHTMAEWKVAVLAGANVVTTDTDF
jgi:thiol-disulfide isomerase/thioredoxin